MNNKNTKIEELLNSYLDGELSQRELTEVRRLVDRDESVACRLRELERCRLLVSSLPPAEPPAELVSGIQKLLHGRMTGVAGERDETRLGTLHLFMRQVLAASIIIGLAGLLMVVVFRIIGPGQPVPGTVAVQPGTTASTASPKAAGAVADEAGTGFYSLQIETDNFTAVDAFVNKLLGESPWLKFDSARELPGRSVYRVVCSRGGLKTLVYDLAPAWTEFDSTTLVVHTDVSQYVTVESVRPEQITEIANQQTPDEQIKLAKDFAVLNSAERLASVQHVLAPADSDYPALTPIPRPVLTSGEERTADMPKDATDRVRVDLTIVVTGHK